MGKYEMYITEQVDSFLVYWQVTILSLFVFIVMM
jgi:hypothetical protein